MSGPRPLGNLEPKKKLLEHLSMPPRTYKLMESEAAKVYKELISMHNHPKRDLKRPLPCWTDFLNKSKNDAMERIAQSGDEHTSHYWRLAVSTPGCPNWIARWFLYHAYRNDLEKQGLRRKPRGSRKRLAQKQHPVPCQKPMHFFDPVRAALKDVRQ